jgi:hypothetical protein
MNHAGHHQMQHGQDLSPDTPLKAEQDRTRSKTPVLSVRKKDRQLLFQVHLPPYCLKSRI